MNASSGDQDYLQMALDIVVRLAFVALFVVGCLRIISPFLVPVIWGTIIAIAFFPTFEKLERAIGGRRKLAAAVFIIVTLAAVVVPALFQLLYGVQFSKEFQMVSTLFSPSFGLMHNSETEFGHVSGRSACKNCKLGIILMTLQTGYTANPTHLCSDSDSSSSVISIVCYAIPSIHVAIQNHLPLPKYPHEHGSHNLVTHQS